MKTMKWFAKQIENGKYGLAVIDEDGIVVTNFVMNGNLEDVYRIENWFDFSKLTDRQYLMRFMTVDGIHWWQDIDQNGPGNWARMGC